MQTGRGVTNFFWTSYVKWFPEMEDDCHPALEERLAAEAAPHGLLVAVQLHAVLLEEAKGGEGLGACLALEGALLHQRIHLFDGVSTDCIVNCCLYFGLKEAAVPVFIYNMLLGYSIGHGLGLDRL